MTQEIIAWCIIVAFYLFVVGPIVTRTSEYWKAALLGILVLPVCFMAVTWAILVVLQ